MADIPTLIHATLAKYRLPFTMPEITLDTHLDDDLRCDGVDRESIRCDLEDAFGFVMSDAVLEKCETVGDLVRACGEACMTNAGDGR